MPTILGKDERLGHLGATREEGGEEAIAVGMDDGANMIGSHHFTVQLIGSIANLLIHLFPAFGPRQPVAPIHIVIPLDGAAPFGNRRANAVDLLIPINAIRHRPLMPVLHDQILMEEAKSLLA